MTVNTTSITSGPYTGNGVTTSFPYTFKAFTDANVIVYQTVGTSQSTLTLGTHYSVTGTGIDGGGNVVMVTAPASGDEIYIRSNYSAEQLTDFDSQGGFYPDTHEDAFDKQTMLIQQLEDIQGRGLRLPLGDSDGVMPELTPSPLGLLRWNAAGDAVENAAIETIDPDAFDTSLITQKIDTWTDISTVTPTNVGQLFTLAQHTSGGLGGGTLMAFAGSVTDDNTSQKNCLGGFYLKRVGAFVPTPYLAGWLDGGTNAAIAINSCTTAYGECYLTGGTTYNIQTQVRAVKLKSIGKGYATLNCTSPTANTRFGELGAAVYVSPNFTYGDTTNLGTLKGVEIEGIKILCNQLINNTGSTGLKGFMFYRCENFYQRNCYVDQCASYAYWDTDVSGTGTLYCSGTRDDCIAIDAAVSFEQVNVRGITLTNCYAYTSTATLSYVPECQYHAYGGSDMRIVYNNCTGIADGACPAIVSLALEVKGLAMNDCNFINNHNGGVDIRAALYTEASGGNFGKINAKNTTFKSAFNNSVIVSVGASGSSSGRFTFTDCQIEGVGSAVTVGGVIGIFEFTNCNTLATASGGVTPWAYYNNGAPTLFKVVGGKATASGGVLPAYPSNFSQTNFYAVTASPLTSSIPVIKQQVIGTATLNNGGDNANYLVNMTESITDWAKCVCSMHIDSTGMSSADGATFAAPFTFNQLNATQVRGYTAVANHGKTVKYSITEYF